MDEAGKAAVSRSVTLIGSFFCGRSASSVDIARCTVDFWPHSPHDDGHPERVVGLQSYFAFVPSGLRVKAPTVFFAGLACEHQGEQLLDEFHVTWRPVTSVCGSGLL